MCREQIVRVISAYDDLIVRTYRWCRFLIIRKRFLDEIGQYLPADGTILDIGCGFGLFSLYCAQVLAAVRFRGLDLSPRRVRLAAEATAALLRLRRELTLVNESAVRSVDEGLEETLTLHRLGLVGPLGISLTTTNCLESLNAQLGAYTAKVDRWRSSDQQQRWVASALLTIEPRLRRIKGYRHLLLLRAALQREVASSTQRRESVA